MNNIEYVPIGKIKPNDKNPRIISEAKYKALLKSIKEFPEMLEKRPIVCITDTDGNYVALGGNMRLKALVELKHENVPIILADAWSEKKRNQFLITDNVSFGTWDWELLANEWNTEDLTDWGLDVWNANSQLLDIDTSYESDGPGEQNVGDRKEIKYVAYELIMQIENKVILVNILNKVKEKFGYDTSEEAIMEIVNNYKI